ncbi:uncharacterized protein EV420DRAFT_256593 [Desarmillaria tabescens]|uniref:Mid2 domain-containing protein n=1 Tax=Armillaria tabescens TaxID=1929756 RepID=A0AA39KFJ6_ARMTA|nr:uncharacterized protein EV420DRAFT_256593 [Desarmillaria tabescens]KAK0460252.1 hypothetical protein EV420DRAFT_256593 [Desarmillaria tabescens]
MILNLLYSFLFTLISRGCSLSITVTTPPHFQANQTISVLLTPSSEDPFHFFIAVRRMSPPDTNFTSSIQPVDNLTEARIVSVDLEFSGTTYIVAQRISPIDLSSNVTFALSEPFQVDEGREIDVSSPTLSNVDESATMSSTMIASTPGASDSSPSKHDHTPTTIAGIVISVFLLVLIAASVFIWRYRKRRNIPPSRAFLNDLDDKRHLRASPNDHSPDVPPPAYSPRISRLTSISRWWEPRSYDPATLKSPLKV